MLNDNWENRVTHQSAHGGSDHMFGPEDSNWFGVYFNNRLTSSATHYASLHEHCIDEADGCAYDKTSPDTQMWDAKKVEMKYMPN